MATSTQVHVVEIVLDETEQADGSLQQLLVSFYATAAKRGYRIVADTSELFDDSVDLERYGLEYNDFGVLVQPELDDGISEPS